MSNPLVEERKKDAHRKQGSSGKGDTKAGFLAEQRAIRNRNRGSGVGIEWANADSSAVLALINHAVGRGCTITFGATKDGGALRLSLYDGCDTAHEYCRATEDIEVFVQMLTEMFTNG